MSHHSGVYPLRNFEGGATRTTPLTFGIAIVTKFKRGNSVNAFCPTQRSFSDILSDTTTALFTVLRSTTLKVLALVLFLSAAAGTEAAIYMDFGDFPGEATKEPHVDWIDVLSFSAGDYRPEKFFGTNPSGGSTLQDIVVTKETSATDKSTPKLTESILTGTVHDKVVLDFATSTAGTGPEPTYFQIELEKVRLTSQSFSGGGGGDPTMETVTLNAEKIKWVYTEIVDSEEKGKIVFAWDVIRGEPASMPHLPGDYNRNGRVDDLDLAEWQRLSGTPIEASENDADIGVIDSGLYDIWQANYGRVVPEPGSLTLAALGLAAISVSVRRRKRHRF
jgi:type VI secretion system Hcp family effector